MDPQHHQLVHQKAHLVTLQLAHQHQVLDNLKYATKFFLKIMIYIQRFNSDSLVYLQSNPHKVGITIQSVIFKLNILLPILLQEEF